MEPQPDFANCPCLYPLGSLVFKPTTNSAGAQPCHLAQLNQSHCGSHDNDLGTWCRSASQSWATVDLGSRSSLNGNSTWIFHKRHQPKADMRIPARNGTPCPSPILTNLQKNIKNASPLRKYKRSPNVYKLGIAEARNRDFSVTTVKCSAILQTRD